MKLQIKHYIINVNYKINGNTNYPAEIWLDYKMGDKDMKSEIIFYLAGGAGLALLIGHRKSIDFDFFRFVGNNFFIN